MKRIFILTGLVMAAVCVVGCSLRKSPVPEDDPSLTTITYEGKTYKVDAKLTSQFSNMAIAQECDRDEYVAKVKRPANADNFGKKLRVSEWKVFDTYENPSGTAVVTIYEKGVEVTKDGKSWFYERKYCTEFNNDRYLSASESMLHPGQWEPVLVVPGGSNSYRFTFIYNCGYNLTIFYLLLDYQLKAVGASRIVNLRVKDTQF